MSSVRVALSHRNRSGVILYIKIMIKNSKPYRLRVAGTGHRHFLLACLAASINVNIIFVTLHYMNC